jgi:hypothetical protein
MKKITFPGPVKLPLKKQREKQMNSVLPQSPFPADATIQSRQMAKLDRFFNERRVDFQAL